MAIDAHFGGGESFERGHHLALSIHQLVMEEAPGAFATVAVLAEDTAFSALDAFAVLQPVPVLALLARAALAHFAFVLTGIALFARPVLHAPVVTMSALFAHATLALVAVVQVAILALFAFAMVVQVVVRHTLLALPMLATLAVAIARATQAAGSTVCRGSDGERQKAQSNKNQTPRSDHCQIAR